MKFKEYITEKVDLEKILQIVKDSNKEIKDAKIVKVSGGEYIEVTFKNSEFRAETIKTLKKQIKNAEYDYDGTALLITV